MDMTKSKRAAVKKSSKKAGARPGPRPVRATDVAAGDGIAASRVERLRDEGVHSMNVEEISRSASADVTVPGGEPGRYVYGIIEAFDSLTFGRSGLAGAGEQVYTIPFNDIAAVVSKTNIFIFDPTRENALAHEHVIETVMKTNTIIPMSFGTVFRTDDDIREVLKSIYASLKDVLKQMSGKVEFGLKVSWDRDNIIEQLKREDEEIRRFHQELTRKHLQSTYFARMQLGRMIDKALVERSAEFVRQIYEGLRSVCVASRDNKPIGDKMIMNAAFLIDRKREEEFDAAVNRVAKNFGDRLNFKYTGPWPPYNFVNIRLKLERGTAS
jgi:hypothetical protein